MAIQAGIPIPGILMVFILIRARIFLTQKIPDLLNLYIKTLEMLTWFIPASFRIIGEIFGFDTLYKITFAIFL